MPFRSCRFSFRPPVYMCQCIVVTQLLRSTRLSSLWWTVRICWRPRKTDEYLKPYRIVVVVVELSTKTPIVCMTGEPILSVKRLTVDFLQSLNKITTINTTYTLESLFNTQYNNFFYKTMQFSFKHFSIQPINRRLLSNI